MCEKCIHKLGLTMSDVSCCNCCEDGDMFESATDEEEDV